MVGLVTTKAATRGSVRTYLDGVLRKTLSLHAAKTTYRVLAWSYRWSTVGTHTIKLVVVRTARHPRFDADAVAVVR